MDDSGFDIMTSFSGKQLHMEYFTGTTDGSGDLTVVLSSTPVNTANQFIINSNTEGVIPKVKSITGTTLVVTFNKFQYSKMSSTATDADNVPDGVTATGTIQNTSASSSGNTLIDASASVTTGGHVHAVEHQYIHSHDVSTFATTDKTVEVSTSLAVSLTVLYTVT